MIKELNVSGFEEAGIEYGLSGIENLIVQLMNLSVNYCVSSKNLIKLLWVFCEKFRC